MKQKKNTSTLGQSALSDTSIPWRLYSCSTSCAGTSVVKDMVSEYLVADFRGSYFSGINDP